MEIYIFMNIKEKNEPTDLTQSIIQYAFLMSLCFFKYVGNSWFHVHWFGSTL